MAPENLDSPFANPFAAGNPFATTLAAPGQDTDVDAQVEPIDGDEDVDAAAPPAPSGAAFGLVFQAADPTTRVPKRSRRADAGSADDGSESASQDTRDGGDDDTQDGSDDTEGTSRSSRSRGRRRRGDDKGGEEHKSASHGEGSGNDAQDGEHEPTDARDEREARDADDSDEHDDEHTPRRRRRGGRGRRSKGDDSSQRHDSDADDADEAKNTDSKSDDSDDANDDSGSRKRTRRRRRSASGQGSDSDDPNTVTKVREPRRAKDEITPIKGSVRLEAKKQRRREGREAGRRRTVITEAEFLARRESVERVMVVREQEGRTQIGVLEDGVLAEHYVSRQEQASSMAGNVYLGRVQNVLPSMEAAFVDIGRGRNAVLYAGEVNWDAAGLDNQPKRIEHALKAGESVLVQVTKDPIGHKGARLTSQISLPGRFVVFVPGNSMTGISRKLPDTERARLKRILKEVVPADAGVIVRTAAEGASEEELRADVERLMKMWERIQTKSQTAHAPTLLHGEPDLTVRVIRDVFNEDFAKMVVSGDRAWNEVHTYISDVAPDLLERLEKWDGDGDVFAKHRIDEQLAKAMDRKVWLPSGGSLVIDRTEAMTVVDVNTGKFVGSGGNLEETVTKNNIEAAEEIVRQLRLRDIGGIIVVDFIDMVLEANRELVVRRLLECLGRDRTKHQVAEVTSLGLVQMTRKRVGAGLVEMFSDTCEHCQGRGIVVHDHPVENRDINGNDTNRKGRGGRSGRGGRDTSGNGSNGSNNGGGSNGAAPQNRLADSGETAAERDNRFAQIAAAAHAAAVSVGDKAATSKPVSTSSDADAVMTVSDDSSVPHSSDDDAAAAPEAGHVDRPKKSSGRRSGRVKPRAERASDEATSNAVETASAPATDAPAATAPTTATSSTTPTARRRGSRRAATSTGAPARTAEAGVMTVPAASSANASSTEKASPANEAQSDAPTTATQQTRGSAVSGSEATTTASTGSSTTKRPRRRAGSSAGAPVTLQPVDLSAPAPSGTTLTKIAGESESKTGSVAASGADESSTSATADDAPTAPARKKRARVSSPAGSPTPKTSDAD